MEISPHKASWKKGTKSFKKELRAVLKKQNEGKTCCHVRPQEHKGGGGVSFVYLLLLNLYCQSPYLKVAVDHAHLVAVEHSL